MSGLDSLFDLQRPPYSVPSMADSLLPDNGLTAVSTFSGCGGSSLGLHRAGWRIPYAAEFTPEGSRTYRANFPDTYVDERDIRLIQPGDILDHLGIAPGELDLFEGSPPCSSFSAAGVRAGGQYEDRVGRVKAYSEGINQRTDDLFDEWVRLVDGLRPRALIAENVPDMAKPGSAQEYLFKILRMLQALDYDVHASVYSSLGVGCATMRKRLVILGVRRYVGITPPRPQLTGAGYTLREALDALPIPIPEDELNESWFDGSGRDSEGNPLPRYQIADHWEYCLSPGKSHDADICQRPGPDGSRPMLFGLWRASWDRPAGTFTMTGKIRGAATVVHPDEPRKFTATELKWISGFPADFVLTGTPQNRYERIGRAVTPPLYAALGEHMARALKAGR